jgi:hypothetical protein
MVRLRWIHYVLLMVCAVLALGTIYDRSICGLVRKGAWNRAAECIVSNPDCHRQSGLCTNQEGQVVQYNSWREVEEDYETCLPAPHSVFRCEVLDTQSPCKRTLYYLGYSCDGAVVCEDSVKVNNCRTL